MKAAFIGHRKIKFSAELKERVKKIAAELITSEGIDTFLFGSKSEFNDLCYEVVTELRAQYPHIKRVFVRAEYEYIDESYLTYLLTLYEDTFYPPQVHGAGKSAYIKRNQVMIDISDVLVTYCHIKPISQSGTQLSVAYARKKNRRIINVLGQ